MLFKLSALNFIESHSLFVFLNIGIIDVGLCFTPFVIAGLRVRIVLLYFRILASTFVVVDSF